MCNLINTHTHTHVHRRPSQGTKQRAYLSLASFIADRSDDDHHHNYDDGHQHGDDYNRSSLSDISAAVFLTSQPKVTMGAILSRSDREQFFDDSCRFRRVYTMNKRFGVVKRLGLLCRRESIPCNVGIIIYCTVLSAPRNLLTRWDVSSIPANGIFLTKN